MERSLSDFPPMPLPQQQWALSQMVTYLFVIGALES